MPKAVYRVQTVQMRYMIMAKRMNGHVQIVVKSRDFRSPHFTPPRLRPSFWPIPEYLALSLWKKRSNRMSVFVSLLFRIDYEGLASNSCGDFRLFGSLSKQPSMNEVADSGNSRLRLTSLGAGSLTIWCSNSRILIVWPPPPKLTPLSFFFFLPSSLGGLEDRGRVGSGSTRSSSLSEAESGESENGNRPRASSMRDTPSDQTSDLIV